MKLALAAPGDEVWVAAGAYTNLVRLKAGVALLGGFCGDEMARAQRNWLVNETILDGGGTNMVVLVESGGSETVGNTAGTGAGLHFNAYRAGRVENNLFVGNHTYDPTAFGGMGGGIAFTLVPPATNLVIANNLIVSSSSGL